MSTLNSTALQAYVMIRQRRVARVISVAALALTLIGAGATTAWAKPTREGYTPYEHATHCASVDPRRASERAHAQRYVATRYRMGYLP